MKKIPHSKIVIIGAGAVGSTLAFTLSIKNSAAEIVLIDIDNEKEKGHAMDITDGRCMMETGSVRGGNWADARDADIVVITAGATQKQHNTESRLALKEKNKEIFASIIKSIKKFRKDAILIIISNPVDVLTEYAMKIVKLPKHQIIGTGTLLDTARLRDTVGKALNVHPQNVHGYALGEHGNSGFIAWSSVTVGGVPAKEITPLTEAKKKKIESIVVKRAYDIIHRKGATYYGIGTVTSKLIEAIMHDQHRIFPVSTYISGYNGITKAVCGVPAVIGRNGVEKIWPLKLNAKEKKQLKKSTAILAEHK